LFFSVIHGGSYQYIDFYLFTTGHECQKLPKHPQIHIVKFPYIRINIRPRRLFQHLTSLIDEYVICHRFSQLYSPIWHSTYYTFMNSWMGPRVVTVHDLIYERYPALFDSAGDRKFRKQRKECIKQSNIIVCNSETTKRDVESQFSVPSEKCYVTPLACGDAFKVLDNNIIWNKIPGFPYLLYIGRRVHYKNFRKLLFAYSHWSLREKISLIVASYEPWTNEEQRLLSELRIQDKVQLVQNPDNIQLCELYNRADAFVFPSLYEGFGIPLLEAMNCGCPIVASDIPSTIEVARDVPIYFEPSDENQLISALDQAVSEGKNGQRILRGFEVAKEYSWDITARKTLEIYRSLG